MEKILVVAGNRKQFDSWIREHVIAERDMFVYADAKAFYGMRYAAVLKIGTYYENNDWGHIRDAISHYFPDSNY
jgi:hypothetical protein